MDRPELFYSKEKAMVPSPHVYQTHYNALKSYDSRTMRSSARSKDESVSGEHPADTSFGVGRNAYKKVVSTTGFNY